MVEQRIDARWALNLPAVFLTRAWGRLPGVIKDFCAGGALLGFREPDAAKLHGLKRGDGLVIQLRVAGESETGLQELRCRVAHMSPGLVGVAFVNPPESTLTALSRLAQVPELTLPVSDAVRLVLDSLYTRAAKYYQLSFSQFEKLAELRLMAASEETRSLRDQAALLDMLAAFRRQLYPIRQRYHQTLQAGISQFNAGAIRPDTRDVTQLALIDKSEFEEWLTVKVMVSRVETRCRGDLNALQTRLDALTQAPPGRQFNPFSCAFLCQAFQQALNLIKPPVAVEKLFYKAFEDTVLAGLQGLYIELNEALAREQVLPGLTPMAPVADLPVKADDDLAAPPEESVDEAPLPLKTAADLMLSLGRPLPPAEPAAQLAFRPLSRPLLQMWAELNAPDDEGQGEVLSATECDDLLSELGGLADSRGWRQRLAEAAAEQGSQVPTRILGLCHMVDALFGFLLEQAPLSKAMAQEVARLSFPVLRAFLQDDSLFEQAQHPVRRVLNGVVTLARHDEAMQPEDRQALTALVRRLSYRAAPEAQVFAREVEELDELCARLELEHRLNMERLVRRSKGEQRLAQGRVRVQEALDARMAGQTVPLAVLSLLEAGWQELLVATLVREGEDSVSWRAYWQVLDDLLRVPREPDRRVDWRIMLASIKAGLERHAGTQGRPQHVALTELKQLVAYTKAPALEELPMVRVSPKRAAVDLNGDARWLQKWLERVSRLHRGDVVELRHKNAEPERLHLAWVAEDHSRFIFADQQGHQLHEFDQRELAALLRNGHAMVAERLTLPPLDAAAEAVVRDLYDQMIWYATHDGLTGMVNHREFGRIAERAVHRAKCARAHHVLAVINIDRFRLLNREAGLEAGDKLLQEVAHLLAKPLKPRSTLARLNGDEFGLLLEDCDLGEAQQLLSLRLSDLAAARFTHEGKSFRINASAGLCDITYASNDYSSLLQAAEAACALAKEQGGNRIQVYHPDNVELARRDEVVAWVAKLNQALEDERLQLRCQRIQAVDKGRAADELPHYEILLGLQDGSGEQWPPAVFVQAAERYNRMQAVDRWVIEQTLRWLADHPEKFAGLGQVSINLSGHSLNDVHLLEYIIERMAHWKIEPQKICFEVTETTAIANLADAADLIRELKLCGCRFALDDFGMGQSSYHYLKHLPVDYVKIDGAFVRDMITNPQDDLIVRSINEMAHVMGRETIAEYVESNAILQRLGEIGVDYAQGYGIERPRWLANL